MAESKEDLQKSLNCFHDYCKKWKLKVNIGKTKVLIFSRGRLSQNLSFTYDNKNLEITNEFTYLGLVFSKTGSFKANQKMLVKKATSAMYDVLRKGRHNNLSIKCHLDLFDKVVKPILLYGCELWGFENTDLIERVHLKFCKILLHLKESTPSYMVYGELGRYPLNIDIKVRMISYWAKLLCGKQSKISSILYKLIYRKFQNDPALDYKWLNSIKSLFTECGFNYIWESQAFLNVKWLTANTKARLLDQFKQLWSSNIQNSPKALFYRIFKHTLDYEKYLDILEPKFKFILAKFRTTNHKFPVELGRWNNIAIENRICHLCNCNEIGDEFHYLFQCENFSCDRSLFIPSFYASRPNTFKLDKLMNIHKTSLLRKLCKYIEVVNKRICTP